MADPLGITDAINASFNYFGASTLVKILVLFLGYSLFFALTYNIKAKKFKYEFNEVDKVILSGVIGISVYLLLYAILGGFLIYFLNDLFLQTNTIIDILNNLIGYLLLLSIASIWFSIFSEKERKTSLLALEIGLYLIFFIAWGTAIISLAAFFSAYSIFSYILIWTSIGLVILTFVCLRTYKNNKNRFNFPKIKFRKNDKKNLSILLIILIVLLGVVSYFSMPQVHPTSETLDYYYLDGNQTPIDNVQNYNFGILYEHRSKQFSIDSQGWYGWIPFEIGNFTTKNLDFDLIYQSNFGIILDVNSTYKTDLITLAQQYDEFNKLGLKNIIYFNNSNVVILVGSNFIFNNINLTGFVIDQENIYKIEIPQTHLKPSNNQSYIEVNITNRLEKPLFIKNMYIKKFQYVGSQCYITNASGVFTNATKSIPIDSISCINQWYCQPSTNVIDGFWANIQNPDINNVFTLAGMMLPKQSSIFMNLTFNCPYQ